LAKKNNKEMVIKKIAFFAILLFLIGCKTREKQVQKSENQTETKSEATYKIEDKTFEIVSEKELLKFDKSTIDKSEETKKDETKNIEVIREYYENGNLKSEYQKSFSQLSEATKTAIAEMREKLSKETEDKKYFENSSNHYYSLWQQEKAKSKTKDLQVKSKPTYTWQMFFLGLFLGWLFLPSFFRWIFSWVKRFQPYLKLIEWIKSFKN
jgi:Fe2+ transport system protein B